MKGPLLVALVVVALPVQGQTTVAGFTPGSFRVSESGAAEYRIPIRVPPGIAGMEPKLALAYNSQSGNGLLGVGWNLEGLSAITRCPRTMAQDGVRGGVNYDGNDRFCLDGQRLIAISGSYGANGTEYRTERESFTKVISYGTAGNGPAWFKVWTKSGQILEYGNTADSRIEAQGKTTVRVWAVNKISDTTGNYLTVSYTEDSANGEYSADRIDYTGNGGLVPGNSVRFSFSSRPDSISRYMAGSLIKTVSRLTAIQTDRGTSQVSNYSLEYEQGTTTQRSRVKAISECAGSGATCLSSSSIVWQEGGSIGYPAWTWSTPAAMVGIADPLYFADVDGDGKTDMIMIGRSHNVYDDQVFVALSDGTGYSGWTWTSPGPMVDFQNSVRFVDVNGDGKADLVAVGRSGNVNDGKIFVALSDGSGYPSWSWMSSAAMVGVNDFVDFADVDGDGRADLVMKGTSYNAYDGQIFVSLSDGTGYGAGWTWSSASAMVGIADSIYFADMNGDGMADLVMRGQSHNAYDGQVFVALSSGAGYGTGWSWISPAPMVDLSNPVHFVDVNGDGLADMVNIGKSGNANDGKVFVALSDGAGYPGWTWSSPAPMIDMGNPVHFVDVNGDGLADMVNVGKSGNVNDGKVFVAFSTGIGYPAWNWSHSTALFGVADTTYFHDVNGDGKADLIMKGTSHNAYDGQIFLSVGAAPFPDLALSIANGLGSVAAVTYKPLTDAAVYAKDSGANAASYPRVDLQAPLYVVAVATASNGIGGTVATSHQYGGLKTEAGTGRGLLGFRWLESTQQSTGLKGRSENRQDWPYVGMPSLARKTQSSGAALSETNSTYSCTNPATGSACTVAAGNRYFPFVSQNVETGNDLNGAALPTVTTTTQYDAYGNPTSIVASTGDGHSKTTTNTFSDDAVNWLLGRLTRSSVQSTSP